MDLNHLSLRVRDAEACRDFYRQHFAFEHAYEAGGGYFIRNADGFLLGLVPASSHQALPEGFHIGFGLESADAVRSEHAAFKRAGLRVTELRASDDDVTFRCWDPDGTEIEVFWEA